MIAADRVDEGIQGGPVALHLNLHGAGLVEHPTGQTAVAGGSVNKRPEAHALNHAAHVDQPTALRRRCGWGR